MQEGEPFMITRTIQDVTLALLIGDITSVRTEAIVNAANSGLVGGGGVDGAIHRAAGPSVMEECHRIGGCPTGSAVATGAGKLAAKYIFHAVGPIYHRQSEQKDEQLLRNAYQSCLQLAESYQVHSIAFPAISTGVYGYPLSLAAPVALQTIIEHLQQPTDLQEVLVVLYDRQAFAIFEQALQQLLPA